MFHQLKYCKYIQEESTAKENHILSDMVFQLKIWDIGYDLNHRIKYAISNMVHTTINLRWALKLAISTYGAPKALTP